MNNITILSIVNKIISNNVTDIRLSEHEIYSVVYFLLLILNQITFFILKKKFGKNLSVHHIVSNKNNFNGINEFILKIMFHKVILN